jgi:hypothetical protein
MIGFLLYLCASRSDIMLSVCMCVRFQATSKKCHLMAVKIILRYLVYTPCLGLWYSKGSTFNLHSYSNSDYAGCRVDRKDYIGNLPISWLVSSILEFKETKFHCSIHRRGRVCCCRCLLCAITLDEVYFERLWL